MAASIHPVADRPWIGTTVTQNTASQIAPSSSAETHAPSRIVHKTGRIPPATTASWTPEIPKNQPILSLE